jgi:hypothetical protein
VLVQVGEAVRCAEAIKVDQRAAAGRQPVADNFLSLVVGEEI